MRMAKEEIKHVLAAVNRGWTKKGGGSFPWVQRMGGGNGGVACWRNGGEWKLGATSRGRCGQTWVERFGFITSVRIFLKNLLNTSFQAREKFTICAKTVCVFACLNDTSHLLTSTLRVDCTDKKCRKLGCHRRCRAASGFQSTAWQGENFY